MIDVDELQVVELLQQKVAGIVKNVAARVVVHALQEHFVGDAVVQVLARVDLVADVDTGLVEGIQDRCPAARQFVEGGLHQAGRPLRPGVDERPGQAAGKGDVGLEPQIARRLGGKLQLVDRPLLAGGWVAANLGRRKTVEGGIVGRMHGD